ncbi:nucleopolyhedrovirus P10 family protein [Streptomyces sp. NEAU-sy36]|uniref:nucleopolyhedrovirus P10 family protein n=1 Tax=unclassified Streptomyces TaxID=2593676 RepID=UPI0015D5A6D1|nr:MULTISPECIES: nucleopolyhedrovirus P10 family protein [unclassified Streptomyces]QLJ01097.1 nucleopolyhedrovirus P10 family protein [Streptomyces sp. NEAU-sy36]
MTADGWTQVVRHHVGLGRLLPLGGPGDGAWIAEAAAVAVLRRAADEVPGVRLGALRIGLAHPATVAEPAVPAPPSALPPGALRLTADFAAAFAEPLQAAAARLRRALATAADERLGLAVTEVDLRVTDLLETAGAARQAPPPQPPPAQEVTPPAGDPAAAAARSVPGVARLTGLRVETRAGGTATLTHRHVRVDLAATAAHRTADVARRVRAAVRDALADRPTVAVLVTAVDEQAPAGPA